MCDCKCAAGCHGQLLVNTRACSAGTDRDSSESSFSDSEFLTESGCADEDQSEAAYHLRRGHHPPSGSGTADETLRGASPPRPLRFTDAWEALVQTIRAFRARTVWELFSGAAVLTMAFADAGWAVGPPLDSATGAESSRARTHARARVPNNGRMRGQTANAIRRYAFVPMLSDPCYSFSGAAPGAGSWAGS